MLNSIIKVLILLCISFVVADESTETISSSSDTQQQPPQIPHKNNGSPSQRQDGLIYPNINANQLKNLPDGSSTNNCYKALPDWCHILIIITSFCVSGLALYFVFISK